MSDQDRADGGLEAAKADRFLDRDPLRRVRPSLLGRADIEAYAEAVGLIHPFRQDEEHLKYASYEVGFGG